MTGMLEVVRTGEKFAEWWPLPKEVRYVKRGMHEVNVPYRTNELCGYFDDGSIPLAPSFEVERVRLQPQWARNEDRMWISPPMGYSEKTDTVYIEDSPHSEAIAVQRYKDGPIEWLDVRPCAACGRETTNPEICSRCVLRMRSRRWAL